MNQQGNTSKSLDTCVLVEKQTEHYTYRQELKKGIEWISYIPHERKHAVPILMQHGMWHGAWCWQWWQECLAEWGWESYSISLPGHGLSPVQRPIRWCTLDYYLQFIRTAVASLPQKPVLMGHSMGGALTQWYLRDVGNLPAAVLVAPWALYKGFFACVEAFNRLDFVGGVISYATLSAKWVRNPYRAGRALLSDDPIISAEETFKRLGSESILVMLQHLRPWVIPPSVTTPVLWLGAEKDTLIPEYAARRAASIYPKGEYMMVPGAAHNIMMERRYREIAQDVDRWLRSTLN